MAKKFTITKAAKHLGISWTRKIESVKGMQKKARAKVQDMNKGRSKLSVLTRRHGDKKAEKRQRAPISKLLKPAKKDK